MILGLLLLSGPGRADDEARAWETLYDARLVEAVDGTPEVAVMFYEELLRDLRPTDPAWGQTCYALGRARWELGERDAAVSALRQAARVPDTRVAANALLARIDLAGRAIRALPATIPFQGSTGGFVRAGEFAEKGTLEIRPVEGNPALAWNTRVETGQEDRVTVALEPGLALREVSFRVRAGAFPATLAVVVVDGAGGRYAAPPVTVPVDGWLEVNLPIASFRAEGDDARPPGVRLLELVDRTGLAGDNAGSNTLLVDDVVLR